MAIIHNDRISKYNYNNYSDLLGKIISKNSIVIHKKIVNMNNSEFDKKLKKIKAGKEIRLPDIGKIIPEGLLSKKTNERGIKISNNLKKEIVDKLKGILEKPEYVKQRGKFTGEIKKQAIDEFKNGIKETFTNYTKKDPKLGIPKNIDAIATTEMRSVVNTTRDIYMGELLKRNENLISMKAWKHNGSLSKKPRGHHLEMDGVEIEYNANFEMYNKITKKRISTPYPHWDGLPVEEVVSCNCEIRYFVSTL